MGRAVSGSLSATAVPGVSTCVLPATLKPVHAGSNAGRQVGVAEHVALRARLRAAGPVGALLADQLQQVLQA